MDLHRTSYQLDSLSDPCCYKTFSNHFQKSTTSIKVITSINSKINMYQCQKDELSADYLLNNLISFDDHYTQNEVFH